MKTLLPLLALPLLLLAGCTTFNQHLSIAPIKADFPVSASRSVVSAQGTVVSQGSLKIVDSFSFKKRYNVGIHKETFELSLQDDLAKLVRANSADGIVELTVSFRTIDGTVVSYIIMERSTAAIALAIGIPLAYYGFTAKPGDDYDSGYDNTKSINDMRNTGIAFSVTGLALVGLSIYQDLQGGAVYDVTVAGKLFKY